MIRSGPLRKKMKQLTINKAKKLILQKCFNIQEKTEKPVFMDKFDHPISHKCSWHREGSREGTLMITGL